MIKLSVYEHSLSNPPTVIRLPYQLHFGEWVLHVDDETMSWSTSDGLTAGALSDQLLDLAEQYELWLDLSSDPKYFTAESARMFLAIGDGLDERSIEPRQFLGLLAAVSIRRLIPGMK